MPVQKRRQNGCRVSNFALLLAIFKWHHGSERVKQAFPDKFFLLSVQLFMCLLGCLLVYLSSSVQLCVLAWHFCFFVCPTACVRAWLFFVSLSVQLFVCLHGFFVSLSNWLLGFFVSLSSCLCACLAFSNCLCACLAFSNCLCDCLAFLFHCPTVCVIAWLFSLSVQLFVCLHGFFCFFVCPAVCVLAWLFCFFVCPAVCVVAWLFCFFVCPAVCVVAWLFCFFVCPAVCVVAWLPACLCVWVSLIRDLSSVFVWLCLLSLVLLLASFLPATVLCCSLRLNAAPLLQQLSFFTAVLWQLLSFVVAALLQKPSFVITSLLWQLSFVVALCCSSCPLL